MRTAETSPTLASESAPASGAGKASASGAFAKNGVGLMFRDKGDHRKYITETFPEVTDQRIDDDHWDLECPVCKVARGFQLTRQAISGRRNEQYGTFNQDFTAPITLYFRCPVCKTFKQWIVFRLEFEDEKENTFHRYFRVTSLPSEGLEDIAELPTEPPALRAAYRQAVRAMDANAHIAAAAMFRRAVQVITRNVLKAKPGNLANELNEVVGKTFNGVTITANFANVGYIVKEAGNQGAHPDADPDLLDFTAEDARDLQGIFMELVSDLFIIPEAVKKARTDFLSRRKISPKP